VESLWALREREKPSIEGDHAHGLGEDAVPEVCIEDYLDPSTSSREEGFTLGSQRLGIVMSPRVVIIGAGAYSRISRTD
jgi:hypothetical protein